MLAILFVIYTLSAVKSTSDTVYDIYNRDPQAFKELNSKPARVTINGKRHYETPFQTGPAASVTTIISETASGISPLIIRRMRRMISDRTAAKPRTPGGSSHRQSVTNLCAAGAIFFRPDAVITRAMTRPGNLRVKAGRGSVITCNYM